MPGKRILFADADKEAFEEFCKVMGSQWQVTSVTSGMAALGEMQNQSCDVIVACIDLPELDGAELLNHVRVAHPETIRFVTAPADMKERVISHMVGGHQFLAKPFDKATLKNTIERSVSADHLIINANMRELVGRIRTFPTIPSLYLEVISALNNPDATTEDVGAIVAKDMAMTTKMLQVLNSAYFSLPRTITDPGEAVGILGFETVKSLIMSVKLMSQYDKIKPVYFSIDNIWRHSTRVAKIAREFCLIEMGDPVLAASSYTAGLMHDLGKVILAANFDQQYSGAHALARKQGLPLWEVEKDIFGANHGEIGAYLFGLWGMPANIIEAAALHHHPARAAEKTFGPLTAVHIANALEYEDNPGNDTLVIPVLDTHYLAQLDLVDRIDTWREALRTTNEAPPRPAVRPAPAPAPKPAQTAPAPTPAAPAPLTETAALASGRTWNWLHVLYGALGIATVVGLLCWLEFARLESNSDIKDIDPSAQAPVVTTPEVAPQPEKPAVVVANVPIVKPAPAPTPVVAPLAPLAPIPAPLSKTDMALNNLRLQGIFVSSESRSALINGKLLYVNDVVGDCRVMGINATSVTVQCESQQRTLLLK
ncbi:MAG TPA: HDOD domain-containing protein [Verrucomicrobiae bacterium]|jgi:HD-like signal output (HDOD) protein|nr:HDOD domain-containing protein [Verrucomicrobiae bacterium]